MENVSLLGSNGICSFLTNFLLTVILFSNNVGDVFMGQPVISKPITIVTQEKFQQ